jgi:hypothetical protein
MKNKKIIYLLLLGMILIVSEQNIYSNNIDFSRNIFPLFKVIESKIEKKDVVKPNKNKFYLIFLPEIYDKYIYIQYINPNIFNILNNNILKFLE